MDARAFDLPITRIFLCSLASGCINLISGDFPKKCRVQEWSSSSVGVGVRCREIDRCVGGPTVDGLISRDAVRESEVRGPSTHWEEAVKLELRVLRVEPVEVNRDQSQSCGSYDTTACG